MKSQGQPRSKARRPRARAPGSGVNLKPFFRHLPDWIYHDPGYEELTAGQRWVLHIMAGHGRDLLPDGSILVVCGETARAKMNVKGSTYWRYLDEFDELGFVHVIGRGGGTMANTLCIPGARGAADDLRVDRRTTARGKGGSKPMPPSLVCQNATRALASQTETGGLSDCDGTRPKLGAPLVSQDETHSYSASSEIIIHQGGSAADDGCSAGDAERERRRELQDLGIHGNLLREMTTDPGLHPVVIRLLGVRGREMHVDNVAGWVIDQWRQDAHKSPLDPRDISALARFGHLLSVAGYPVTGPVLQNASCVILQDVNGRQIHVGKEKLVPDALVLSRRPRITAGSRLTCQGRDKRLEAAT